MRALPAAGEPNLVALKGTGEESRGRLPKSGIASCGPIAGGQPLTVAHEPKARGRLRIVILDDHLLFAESLELALAAEGYDVRRVAPPERTGSTEALLSAIVRQRPRIVLLDLDLGRFGDGAGLIPGLTEADIDVVVVTAVIDRARWGEAIHLGARTVLAKSRPLQDIRDTVRRIGQGLPVMEQEEREELLGEWHRQGGELAHIRARLELLTPRERQVLGHLMQGRTVHDIALIGVVSEATVRTQVKAVLAKLQVSSQLAAVGLAHQASWRPPPD